jgi:hypothetical protein
MVWQNRTQKFTIIAQDPSVKNKKNIWQGGDLHSSGSRAEGGDEEVILTAEVDVPAEELAPGPRGYRVQVIDYNTSTGEIYTPMEYKLLEEGKYCDPFTEEPDATLLTNPTFHAQNVYAIVMKTLARFEFALGRRVSWSFNGHQLQVAPHAFAEANAFYSKRDQALLFGYFPRRKSKARQISGGGNGQDPVFAGQTEKMEWVFTCLSHDIVVHETTHALVDGLRQRYTDPSSPEQAGFHEGFADVIALLSIFSLPGVVERVIDLGNQARGDSQRIDRKNLTIEALRKSVILGLGEEFGQESDGGVTGIRKAALRRSVELKPPAELDPPKPADYYLKQEEFEEPHRLGELLVAAMMNAFLRVWCERLSRLGDVPVTRPIRQPAPEGFLDRQRVVEEGASVAEYMITMSIRALDYTPPTDLEFCDFLSALLTGDYEIRPDDSRYNFRKTLMESFRAYGIAPTSKYGCNQEGVWQPPEHPLRYDRTRFESLTRDPDEAFRFIWENRKALGLEEDAYTRVLSVRPCMRMNPDDGFVLRETVAEYYQQLNIMADELKQYGIKTPVGMPAELEVTIYGGGSLIFDEFGRVKFHVRNRILNPERQTRRLKYLWKYGYFEPSLAADGGGLHSERRFAEMHKKRFNMFPGMSKRRRSADGGKIKNEQWAGRYEIKESDEELYLSREGERADQ